MTMMEDSMNTSSTSGNDESLLFAKWCRNCVSNQVSVAASESASLSGSGLGSGSTITLEEETERYFTNYISKSKLCDTNNSGVNNDVDSKKSAELSLASLIQSLQSPLSHTSNTSNGTKVNALNCVNGALKSFYQNHHAVSLSTLRLVSKFLLVHIAPFDKHELYSTTDTTANSSTNLSDFKTWDEVRDASLHCIISLIQIPVRHDSKSDGSDDGGAQLDFKIQLSQSAIIHRCASTDYDYQNIDTIDTKLDADSNMTMNVDMDTDLDTLLAGLSSLPRAKRSLCFTVFNSFANYLSSCSSHNNNTQDQLQRQPFTNATSINSTDKLDKFSGFISFASYCLHGETDPRCLLQMLQILSKLQYLIAPLFIYTNNNTNNNHDKITFPFQTLFDAVAPYYPIRFTPPPNDPFRITRDDLHQALMNIFMYQIPLPFNIHDTDSADYDGHNNIMLHLSTELFLERITPPSTIPIDYYAETNHDDGNEDEEYTVQDRIEALNDLITLLNLLQSNYPPKQQFLSSSSSSSSSAGTNTISHGSSNSLVRCSPKVILSQLPSKTIQDLSNILLLCHEYASSTVAANNTTSSLFQEDLGATNTSTTTDHSDYKQLAESCRMVASTIAYEMETITTTTTNVHSSSLSTTGLWNCFVCDLVRKSSSILTTSPQSMKGRTTTAYLASLSACGGAETLVFCLDVCIPLLLSHFTKLQQLIPKNYHDSDTNHSHGNYIKMDKVDTDQICAVAYAIGAFFSSSRVTLDNLHNNQGIDIHPHPLLKYSSPVIRHICNYLDMHKTVDHHGADNDKENYHDDEATVSLHIAFLKALESVLLSSPSGILLKDDLELVRKVIFHFISDFLINDGASLNNDEKKSKLAYHERNLACVRIVGGVIGRSLKDGDNGNDADGVDLCNPNKLTSNALPCVLDDDLILNKYAEENLFPRVFKSSITKDFTNQPLIRYDWMVLSYACEIGPPCVSKIIISKLNQKLVETIPNARSSDADCEAFICSKALRYVLSNGGPLPHQVFHNMILPWKSSLDLIKALTNSLAKEGDDNIRFEAGMSKLMLPKTVDKYRSITSEMIKIIHTILPDILPSFERRIPQTVMTEIISSTANILPPLTDLDGAKLCVMLPILSKVLKFNDSTDPILSNNLRNISSYLVEFTLSKEYDQFARSAAAQCLFLIISKSQIQTVASQEDSKMNSVPSLEESLLTEHIFPVISNSVNGIMDDSQFYKKVEAFEDSINLTSLLGVAASTRGLPFSNLGNEIALFLTELSCTGDGKIPRLGFHLNLKKDTSIKSENDVYRNKMDKVDYSPRKREILLRYITGTALGSMMSIEDLSSPPFWKQKLSHLILPYTTASLDAPVNVVDDGEELKLDDPREVGTLLCACHLVCSVSLHLISKPNREKLIKLIIRASEYSMDSTDDVHNIVIRDLQNMSVVGILKFLGLSETSMVYEHLSEILPNVLMMLLRCKTEETIPTHLLIMQLLLNLTVFNIKNHEQKRLLVAYKEKVLIVIGVCLDSSCIQLRESAVLVKNKWTILE